MTFHGTTLIAIASYASFKLNKLHTKNSKNCKTKVHNGGGGSKTTDKKACKTKTYLHMSKKYRKGVPSPAPLAFCIAEITEEMTTVWYYSKQCSLCPESYARSCHGIRLVRLARSCHGVLTAFQRSCHGVLTGLQGPVMVSWQLCKVLSWCLDSFTRSCHGVLAAMKFLSCY